MRKVLACVTVVLMMTSCYNTKVCVGNVTPEEAVVKVNSVTNHHFLYGLIPGGKTNIEAKKYVGERKNYVIKNNQTFLNGFLSCITCGIYTPMTTTFYTPLDEAK